MGGRSVCGKRPAPVDQLGARCIVRSPFHDNMSHRRHVWSTIMSGGMKEVTMDDREYHAKLDELDHLLNDVDVPMEPARVWDLLAEVSHHDLQQAGQG